MKKFLPAITVFTLLALAAGILWYQKVYMPSHEQNAVAQRMGESVANTQNMSRDNTVIGAADIDTSNWKEYCNEEYGFCVKYPEGWEFSDDDLSLKTPSGTYINFATLSMIDKSSAPNWSAALSDQSHNSHLWMVKCSYNTAQNSYNLPMLTISFDADNCSREMSMYFGTILRVLYLGGNNQWNYLLVSVRNMTPNDSENVDTLVDTIRPHLK